MSNPFDQFDAAQNSAPKNPFDQFDNTEPADRIAQADQYNAELNERMGIAAEAEPPQSERGALQAAGDLGLSVASGTANLGGALAQAADTATKYMPGIGVARAIDEQIGRKYGTPTSAEAFDAARGAAGDVEGYLQNQKSDYSKARAKEIEDADGFWDTAAAYVRNPSQIAEGVAGSLPYMVPVGTAARAAKAAQMTAKGITGVTAGTGAVLEGGAAGSQANREVMDMTAGELLERSPDYAELIAQEIEPEKAKSIVASRAGFTAQALQMPVSFLASKLSGAAKLESEFFTGNQARGMLKIFPMMAREAGEEIAQEGASQFNVNAGVKLYGDENRELMEGVPEAGASGMMIGAAQAGGMKGTGWAVNRMFGDPAPVDPNMDDGIDQPMNGEQVGGGIVGDIPQEAPAEVQQLGYNPERMVVMPDGTTAWESELPALAEQSAVAQHPGYARITETPDQVEASLAEPVAIDDEINSMMMDLDNYRAERVRQTVQPAMETPAITGVNPFDQFDEAQPSGMFDGVRDMQAASANAAREQDAKRRELMSANFQEDEEGGLFSGVRALAEQSRFEPVKNEIDPGDIADIYPPDPALARPKTEIERRTDGALPAGFNDQRLSRPEYRTRLDRMAAELVKGGGVGYVRDSNDRITGRTPSLNADWFKSLNENPDTSMPVTDAQAAIQKALKGDRLGVRQMRVVGAALDAAGEERGTYARELRALRENARADRRNAYEQWLSATNVPVDAEFESAVWPESPGESYSETDYLPDNDMEDRAIAELVETAESFGVDWGDIDTAMEAGDIGTQTQALTQLIWNARNEHRQPATAAEQPAAAGAQSGPGASESTGGTLEEESANLAQPQAEAIAAIDAAASEAALSPLNDLPEPTDAQKEAGNYKKAHVKVKGLDIAIENPRGSTRSGTDSKGNKWEVKMHSHYGYIKRTEGADGDHVDVFIGPNPESDKVFIVDQINPDGSFDEHKVLIGFDSKLRARSGYKSNYSNGWKVGPITSMSMDEFKYWVKNGDTRKPLAVLPNQQPGNIEARKYNKGLSYVSPGELGLGIKANDAVEKYKVEIARERKVRPIEIDESGFIVDGEHRYKAMLDLGIEKIPVFVGTQLGASGRLEKPYSGIRLDVVIPADAKPPLKKLLFKPSLGVEAESDAMAAVETIPGAKVEYKKPDKNLGKVSLVKFDNATIQLEVREEAENIFVTGIASKDPDDLRITAKGTGRGTEVLNKLKEYADNTGKKMSVVDSTESAQSYYEKIPYLKRDVVTLKFDGEDYTPPISYSYTPTKQPQPSAGVAVSGDSKAAEAIQDLGEKIGGARKDSATTPAKKGSRKLDNSDKPAWSRRYVIAQNVDLPGVPNAGKWAILDKQKKDFRGGYAPAVRNYFDTEQEAESAIPLVAMSRNHSVRSAGNGKYEIWRTINDHKRVKVVDLQFDSREDAALYMAENAVDIIETNTTFGEANIPAPPDRERKGPEYRKGNVEGKDFMETFGFRGVEFGNWNNQDDRRALLNDAYDGLMDLASALNIPPKAISLNGDLALAFGARGQGLSSAKAHYERQKAVINLTKENGAGSLAHEWFHALDHYLGRQDGKASSEWKIDEDGTRSFGAKGREDDYASHGFKYSNSGVRQVVRDAYSKLIKTMFKKAETYVEDTRRADEFTGRARKDLEFRINELRADLAEQKDPKYWKRNNKPASVEQLAEFDAIAQQLLDGNDLATDARKIEGGKSSWPYRMSNDSLEKISALYKTVRGRSGFGSGQTVGSLDRLRSAMGTYDSRLKMLAEAQQGSEKMKSVITNFAMDAKELDQGRGTDYWTTPHEMAARAFQGYVEDKIAEQGGVSRFLNYGPEGAGILTPWGFKRPFPTGEERIAINKALDEFIGSLETKETDKGVLLYSLSDKREGKASIARDTAQAIIDRISKDWKVPVKIKLIDTIDDLPNSIKSRMSKSDGGAEPSALIDESTGHVYINLSKVESERSIEELVFHEVYTHFGLRQLMGNEVNAIMGRLYLSLGAAEVDRLAKKYGVNVAAYEKAYEGRPVEMRRAIIAEELLAHMSEHTKPSVVKFAQELVGAIRAWLRKNGFAELAEISESDMRHLLKQARETVTKGKNGDFTGLIYSLSGLTKQDRRALNQQRKLKLPEATQEIADNDELITAWAYISQREESFQLPTSRKKDLVEIARDIEGMNGFVISEADELALQNDYGAENAWRIKTPGGDKAAVFQKGEKVWIDVSDLESGDAGKRIYNIVANYAINTDCVFMGDPAGLSIMAKSRRLENMLSSAMKFGTTRHLQPHKLQLKDDAGVPALKWKKGDDINNIREMIITSYEAVKNQFPEIENLRYDPERDIFEDSTNGREFTRQDFRRLAENARRVHDSGAGGIAPSAGQSTLERAVLTHSILRGTRSEKSAILEQLGGQRSERLTEILYAFPKTRLTGGFSFGGSKTPRGATLPHQLKDSYSQLGGANKTLFEKVKTEVRRQLAPRGLLPREIFDLKIARDGAMNADDSQQRFILTDFYNQVDEVYKKPYADLKSGTRKEINDYLKGDRTNVQLTASMIDVLAKMRTQIQSLSRSYMDELLLDAANFEADGKLEAAAAKRALIETITDNFDNYLHRSYRAFDDPDWPKKVPEDVYQNAVNFLAREYSGSAAPDAAAIEKATKKVDLILHEGTAYDSMGRFISESKLGSKDLSVIKKRKQISPEIRALLGEYEDPAINYAKSVTKMTRLVHNTSFLRQMTDISLQLGYIFEEENRPVGANKKIAAEASEVYAPLNGMYTYPEFEQALRDAVGSSKEPDWYKVMVAANGAVKYGKTVLAPTTAVRNFLSASMFALTSGHWNASHLEKSAKVVKTYFTGKDVRGSREYVNKLLKLGVLYDAPNYRELQDLIKSVNESEHWLATGTRKSGLGKVLNYAQEFYALGDDFWKILGYENEKAMLIKHYSMSEAAAEKEAAERIRNTYPTYSLTGKGIQTLRRFPVIGSFPSFPAEIIRTTFHKFRYFHKDAKALGYGNPSVVAKGVGLALGAGMMAGLSALSAAMFGVDDDEEEAIRQMLPEWSKNSSLFFLGRDDKGQVQYMDLGWLDPYGYWKKPISALARDADTTDKLGDAAWEALSPFLGLDIAVGTTGQFIYDSFFNDSITTEKATEKLVKGLAPGVVNNALGFWEAAHETVAKSGKKYTFEDESLALLGFRKGTLNAKVGLTYQAYGYADRKRQAATVLREKATDLGKVDIDELRAAYEKSIGMQRDAWDDMRRTVKMAMKTGMSQREAVAALRTSGMSLQDASGIVADREFVYKPSKSMMKLAIKRTGILFDKGSQDELRERQKRLRELQREYEEKPLR